LIGGYAERAESVGENAGSGRKGEKNGKERARFDGL